MSPGDLRRAILAKDPVLVDKALEEVETKQDIDDKSSLGNGMTALMIAAQGALRGRVHGGIEYAVILNRLWDKYKQVLRGQEKKHHLRTVLSARGGPNRWTVLMHSARCGDVHNFKTVLGFYEYAYGRDLHDKREVQDMIELVRVDTKVKSLVLDRIFGIGKNRVSTRDKQRTGSHEKKSRLSNTNKMRPRTKNGPDVRTLDASGSCTEHPLAALQENGLPQSTRQPSQPNASPAPREPENPADTHAVDDPRPRDHAAIPESVPSERTPAVRTTVSQNLKELEALVGCGDHTGESFIRRFDRLDGYFELPVRDGMSFPKRIKRLKTCVE